MYPLKRLEVERFVALENTQLKYEYAAPRRLNKSARLSSNILERPPRRPFMDHMRAENWRRNSRSEEIGRESGSSC